MKTVIHIGLTLPSLRLKVALVVLLVLLIESCTLLTANTVLLSMEPQISSSFAADKFSNEKRNLLENYFPTILMSGKKLTLEDKIKEDNTIGDFVFSRVSSQWKTIALKFFFTGAMLIMFWYHLGLYLFTRKDKSSLIFSLLLLFMGLRILLTGNETLVLFFPNVSWENYLKLKYSTTYIAPIFFIYFVKALFPTESKRFPLKAMSFIAVAAALVVVVTASDVFIKMHDYFNVYLIITSSILLYILWLAAVNRQRGARLFLAGHLLFYLALIYDIAFTRQKFDNVELFSTGLLIFILIQSYALSIRFWHAYLKEKDVILKEEEQNLQLEQIIHQRSEDILNQKNMLLEINRELEDQKEDMLAQSEMMDDLNQLLEQEKKKSDSLLLNILPKNIAQELKLYGKAPTYSLSNVSVLFVDFVGFSETVEKVNPQILVDELHYYFANFDDVIKKYNLEKIKTIGDAYMCAGGLHQNADEKDAQSTIYAALEITEFMNAYREERISLDEFFFDCRIGVHTGPVVAGVVGKSKFAFDIWGQTVNIAKETESAGKPGKVNISETTYELVKDAFHCIPRGAITIKHDKLVEMYFVEGKK